MDLLLHSWLLLRDAFPFQLPLCTMVEKNSPKNLSYSAKRSSRCSHQRFQLCDNVSFVSLNIMFFSACKFCNLRASVSAILKKFIRFIPSPLPLRLAQVYLSLTCS
jgi:hypothetical protein